jgi:hypothetical protein
VSYSSDSHFRPDFVAKEKFFDRIGPENVGFVVEDRLRVVAMWRRRGIKVDPVGQAEWTESQAA